MTEYRTERVSPQEQDETAEVLSTFGWELLSAQEIYSEDTQISGVEVKSYGNGFGGGFMKGLTGSDGKITVQQNKTVTNYVTMKFARDTERENYAQLRDLNEEWDNLGNTPMPKAPKIRTAITAVGIALILISVILAIVKSTSPEVWEILVCVLFPVVTIPLTVFSWLSYKKHMGAYNDAVQRLREIYRQAQELV